MAKYGVTGELPDDDGWTGAEIKECCRKAYRLKLTLKESAEYLVPVTRATAYSLTPTSTDILTNGSSFRRSDECRPMPRRRSSQKLSAKAT